MFHVAKVLNMEKYPIYYSRASLKTSFFPLPPLSKRGTERQFLEMPLRNNRVKSSDIYNPERGKFSIIEDFDGNQIHIIEFSQTWLKKINYNPLLIFI